MSDGPVNETTAVPGRVWMLAENPSQPELVFSFPFDEELNESVKRLPRRWFDWRRKHWRVPADPRVSKAVQRLLERFPELIAAPEVLAWLSDSDRFRAVVSVLIHEGAGAFVLRVLSGDPPDELKDAIEVAQDRLVVPFSEESGALLLRLEGLQLDDLARTSARELRAESPRRPRRSRSASVTTASPRSFCSRAGTPARREPSRACPSRIPCNAPGASSPAAAPGAWGCRPIPRWHLTWWASRTSTRECVSTSLCASCSPSCGPSTSARPRRWHSPMPRTPSSTGFSSAASFTRSSELACATRWSDGAPSSPTSRASARPSRRWPPWSPDDAFPAVVVCPASMKLTWERESEHWLPDRSVAVLDGRTDATWTAEAESAEIVVLNYDILEAHADRLAARDLRALVLDESHYVKNAGAQRTKAALELAAQLSDDALRLALTGTPVLNRPEELVSQLRVIGRLREFGSGARLTRRFRDAGSDDRLHWNLRAHCYVRRTKRQVLPQLPAKRHDAVPVALANEQEYRLAEQDVIAWLQTLPLDLRTLDARIASALRAEQLVRLNHLRQLAAAGKLPWPSPGSPTSSRPTSRSWCSPITWPSSGRSRSASPARRTPGRRLVRQPPASGGRLPGRGRASADHLLAQAASQGITLTRASNVAFLELDWTPARHDQAEDRLHRIGQDSAVTAWYLLAPDTIDETMAELLQRKRSVINAVTDGQVRDDERIVDAVARELRKRAPGDLRVVAWGLRVGRRRAGGSRRRGGGSRMGAAVSV